MVMIDFRGEPCFPNVRGDFELQWEEDGLLLCCLFCIVSLLDQVNDLSMTFVATADALPLVCLCFYRNVSRTRTTIIPVTL